ncbi:hypothetical protein LCGC14_0529050 [marine sediment metagenome]|uniref:AAA+ ATPase domain-containing protein n=1 Tax=marine sediment metagenome TaxID=412755 RepID=A0A0F9UHI7_9ZZZZ
MRKGRDVMTGAKFHGKCARCLGDITPGEDIYSTYKYQLQGSSRKTAWIHVGCLEHPDVEPVERQAKGTPESDLDIPDGDESSASSKLIRVLGRDIATVAEDVAELSNKVASIDTAREIKIVLPDRKPVKVGAQHEAFEKLVQYASTGLNIAMKGPAGSGKTSAAYALGKALKLPTYVVPLGPQTSKSDLVGYMNGAGDYIAPMLRRAFEHGGVCLLDEMDAANPAVLTIINGMLANGHAGFADGMVDRHEDTIFLAAMNTFGRGADTEYVGRAQLDAATLDRWVMLEWAYDWNFTRHLAGNDKWTDYVQRLSDAAMAQKVRVVISPRAALFGARLLAAGIARREVEQVCIWAPIKPDDKVKILAAMPTKSGSETADFSGAPPVKKSRW